MFFAYTALCVVFNFFVNEMLSCFVALREGVVFFVQERQTHPLAFDILPPCVSDQSSLKENVVWPCLQHDASTYHLITLVCFRRLASAWMIC